MSLATLTVLEIVLGIDNIIFLSIVTARLPAHQQKRGRRIGLGFALLGRLALLFSLVWMIHLTEPLFSIESFDVSLRDLVLGVGGAVPDLQGHAGDAPDAGRPRITTPSRAPAAFAP